MPDLEVQISEWRQQMVDGGVHSAEVLEELESHLRDDIESQVDTGVSVREAFAAGVARLGPPDTLKLEFDKVGGGAGRRRVKSAFFTLAGIPHGYYSRSTAMTNSPINTEPRWATYTKAAVFLFPAVCLWTFSMIFLMPKLKAICREAGVMLPWIYQAANFFADHFVLLTAAAILPFVLLERRWSRWPQFRRVSVGSAVFVLNASIMALITLMVIFALLAAPNLVSH